MSISSVSMNTTLAGAAAQMKAGDIQAQIAVAVMKQIQDQQQMQAQALLKMMQAAPALDGTGKIVNTFA